MKKNLMTSKIALQHAANGNVAGAVRIVSSAIRAARSETASIELEDLLDEILASTPEQLRVRADSFIRNPA